MKVTSNIGNVVKVITARLQELQNPDPMLREMAFGILGAMKRRVHTEGKDSNNSQIGTYSPSYMELRTGVYNRTADTKVVLSLTRQMENDLSVTGIPKGYVIGYKNPANYKKSQWVEKTYNKRIWSLSADEIRLASLIAEAYLNKVLGEQKPGEEEAA